MVHAFLKGISSKVKFIAPLDVEPAYLDAAAQRFNNYVMENLPV